MALQVPKARALVGKQIRLSASPTLVESAVVAALGDDAYRDFSDLPDVVDPDEELARRQQLIDDRSAAQWAMISLGSGLVCGLLELTVVPGENWIRLGYSTVEGERGRGHATEALRLLTDTIVSISTSLSVIDRDRRPGASEN